MQLRGGVSASAKSKLILITSWFLTKCHKLGGGLNSRNVCSLSLGG